MLSAGAGARTPLPQLAGYTYSLRETLSARDAGRLLCLRLETNYSCNLACCYCYASKQRHAARMMEIDSAKSVIDQACDFGVRSVVYLGGGEPLLYPHFWPLVQYMARRGIVPVVFTNGTLMTPDIAERLFDLGASVLVKCDGSEATQDQMTGQGTYRLIRAAFEMLLRSGFANSRAGPVTRLGVSICATRTNYQEIPAMWRNLRELHVYPNVERATAVGTVDPRLVIGPNESRWLFDTLNSIDQREFGMNWPAPYSALPAHSCYIFLTGCHITVEGGVSLCPEMPPVAHLADAPLGAILRRSPFREARDLDKRIMPPCASCCFLAVCMGGCRSKAYWSGGSVFGPDPLCPLLAPPAGVVRETEDP